MNEIISEAELNMQRTVSLIVSVKDHLFNLGVLLYQNCAIKMYEKLGFDSFKDYTDELKMLSYEKMCRWKQVGEAYSREWLKEDDIMRIDETNLFALIPVLFKTKSAQPGLVELAKYAPTRDFREHLGHSVTLKDEIICPNCGFGFRR